jgi:hypothetical protein
MPVFGPYEHRQRWRLMFEDADGKRSAVSYDTKEEAEEVLAAERSTERDGAVAAFLIGFAVPVPERMPSWVYFLHDEVGAVIYVGCTNDLTARLVKHRVEKEDFHHASCLPRPYPRAEARLLEASAIRILQPKLNVQHAGVGNSDGP